MKLLVSVGSFSGSAVLLSRVSSFNHNILSFVAHYRLFEVMKLLQKMLLLLLLAFPAALLLKGEFLTCSIRPRFQKVSLNEGIVDNSVIPR